MRRGVRIETGVEMSAEQLRALAPDVVVVARGRVRFARGGRGSVLVWSMPGACWTKV